MSKSINVTIRLDEDLKKEAEILFNELGMNMTTAINIFLRQSVRYNGIPFKISANIQNKASLKEIDNDDDIDELF